MLQLPDRAARRAALALSALGAGVFLVCALGSFRRHLHVDELTALYSIQLGAAFGHAEYGLIELSHVLFRPLAQVLGSSENLFVGFRWLELAFLLALCSGVARVQRSLPSPLGRAGVFLAAVSFGPLWRHGFELRHDIFVAFAIVLLVWAAERARNAQLGWWAASATGFGVIIAQANSSKAFTIWLPGLALCALLAARGPGPWLKRYSLACLRFLPGILVGGAFVAALLAASGVLDEYWAQLLHFTRYSSAPAYRLSASPLLDFAIERAPVHACFVAIGLIAALARVVRRAPLGEALTPLAAFALSVLSIAVNPTPFPYNLTWLTPAWLWMAAFGFARSLAFVERAATFPSLGVLLASVAGALALLCFWTCAQDPYYRKTWDGQLRIVATAEALTNPSEPVLDLTGLVVSRPPVARDWLVHSLFMPAYHAGEREPVRGIIERVWPPVAIISYRWSFLDRSDWLRLRRNYVRLSDDVWILGQALSPSDSRLEVHRAGRYQVRANGEVGTLDERALRGGDVLWLERGDHSLNLMHEFTLAWVGPSTPQAPPPAAHPLFVPGELPKQRHTD